MKYNKQKHMTLENRIHIQSALDAGKTMRSIANDIGKDPSTISKEIRKHRVYPKRNTFNDSGNKCALKKECKRKNICDSGSIVCQRKQCRTCPRCNRLCPDFVENDFSCSKLERPPYVCNGCEKKNGCRLQKAYYRANAAHKDYRSILVESRRGINISEEDLIRLDELISPLILQGQSPYMILTNHPEINLSEKTIYNYIDIGALSVKNIDLSKKVKYKVRKTDRDKEKKRDMTIYECRTFKDYQTFLAEHPDIRVVEMDTVIGCEGSKKVLLTFHFNPFEFMMAYLLDSKEAKHVKMIFDQIDDAIGTTLFNKVFQLILTDRGGEFQRPDELECNSDGVIRTSIYYCDPMCSWQKPHCEKNHEYIRRICPKGTSFDGFTQDDINLMMSHINSAARESLAGHTPMDLARIFLPEELLRHFGLKEIHPDNVILKPSLLK